MAREKRYQQLKDIGTNGDGLPSPVSASRRTPTPAKRRARRLLIFLFVMGGISVFLLYAHVRGWALPRPFEEKEAVTRVTTTRSPAASTPTITTPGIDALTPEAPSTVTGTDVNSGAGGDFPPSTTAQPTSASPSNLRPKPLPELAQVPTTPSERISLFVQAVMGLKSDANSWNLPKDWKDWLSPTNRAEQAKALERLAAEGRTTEADSHLYRSDPVAWRLEHTSHGVLVFSKSYCPYSKRAKKLLTDLGAKYSVVEVDLRADAFQPALTKITGHRTFPNIIVGGSLLGGSDDLAALQDKNELEGLLRSVGAL